MYTLETSRSTSGSSSFSSSTSELSAIEIPPLTKYGHFVQVLPSPTNVLFMLRGDSEDDYLLRIKEAMSTVGLPYHSRDRLFLDHLLKKRCPQAVRVHTVLNITAIIVSSDYCDLIISCYVPHAKSITFGNGPYGALTIRLSMVMEMLSKCSDALERLVFHLRYIPERKDETRDDDDDDDNAVDLPNSDDWAHPSEGVHETGLAFRLKSLEFQGIGSESPNYFRIWKSLAPCCGHLEHIQLGNNPKIVTHLMKGFQSGLYSRLNNITFGGTDVATVLNSRRDTHSGSSEGGYWKHLHILDTCEFGQDMKEALSDGAPHLESFVLEGFLDEDVDSALVKLLARQPNLVKFSTVDVMSSLDDVFSQQTIKALRFIDYQDWNLKILRPWSCTTTLTSLRISISGISRPDQIDLAAVEWTREEFPGEGRNMQQEVHRRLGTLVNLESLWLGLDPDLSGSREATFYRIRSDGLEMTLDSGLGALRDLKRMKELNVLSIGHRIGVAEVRWMTEQWPLLHTICGLDNREREVDEDEYVDYYRNDEDEEADVESVVWIKEHCPWIETS